jgi:GMP synthase (glutamine-hydrolysing)
MMTAIAPASHALPQHDRILILDFGSQVTQLIARRVRESGVYCEIWPFNQAEELRIRSFSPRGIILSGGPASVTEQDSPRAPQCVFEMNVPVFGICYGQQTMVEQLGGKVEAGHSREFGRAFVDVTDHSPLLNGIWEQGAKEQVWMSHGDRVTRLPAGFRVVGTSEGAPYAVIANDEHKFYGVQFHPEVVHTPHGAALLRNFTHDVCGCEGDWTMKAFREEAIARLNRAIVETVIDGVKTTLPLHAWIIDHPDFIKGDYTIHWLEKQLAAMAESEKAEEAPAQPKGKAKGEKAA